MSNWCCHAGRAGGTPITLVLYRLPPQVLESKQHREHPFEFAVEMDLVPTQPLQLFRLEGVAECPLTMCYGMVLAIQAEAGEATLVHHASRQRFDDLAARRSQASSRE
jgi:hypothetical protein